MTLHKSKGDEFDYVFIPTMNSKEFPLSLEEHKLKTNANFPEDIKSLNKSYKTKTEEELKEFELAEKYRVLYVAITRAKYKLYLTFSTKEKGYKEIEQREASSIFEISP